MRQNDVSSYSMSFLDFELIKHKHFDASGQLSFKLFRKPTSQAVPLGGDSIHADSIHKSWPIAEIRRIAKRCSNYAFFHDEFTSTLERWGRFNLSNAFGDLSLPCIFNYRTHENKTDGGASRKTFWLVLPYHRSFNAKAIHAFLKGLLLQWSHAMRGLVGEFDIRISFKSFYPCLAARFNRHNISLVR
jgi:hypothetical protein